MSESPPADEISGSPPTQEEKDESPQSFEFFTAPTQEEKYESPQSLEFFTATDQYVKCELLFATSVI